MSSKFEKEYQIRIAGQAKLLKESDVSFQPGETIEQRPGGWSIAHVEWNGVKKRIRFFAQKRKASQTKSAFWAKTGHQDIFGEWERVLKGGAGAANEGSLVAQFPGKVRKIFVKEGQEVSTGEPLMMVEAMKMEFTIKSPKDGKVKKVLVNEEQNISPNQLLVDVE